MHPLPGRPRHELKFLLPISAKQDFLQAVRFGLEPDDHGNEEGAYRVSSLYYDSSDWQAYYEKLDGVLRRRKFRLRYYGDPQETPSVAFFEIKHRYSNLISKERVSLPPELAQSMLELQTEVGELATKLESYPKSMIYSLTKKHQENPLKPAVIVTYLRQAFVGKEDRDLRVTFDHFLHGHAPGDYLSPGKPSCGVGFLDPNLMVLEVKFDRRLPRWLQQRLIQRRLRPVRYSKYVEAGLARSMVLAGAV